MGRLTSDGPPSSPGCLTPWQVERRAEDAPIVGPEDALAVAHLAQCPTCAAAVARAVEHRRVLGTIGSLLREGAGARGADSVPSDAAGTRGAGRWSKRGGATDEERVLLGYRLIAVLGQGGQGTVWRASHEPSGRQAAIKIVRFASPRERARMQREARVAAGLRHPGIVSIFDCGALPDAGFAIAMELVDGVPLDAWRERLAVEGGSPRERLRRTIRVMARVCAALHHAHQHGVIHRDLKPGNILVCADDQPRLLDFGLARAAEPGSGQTLTRTGEFAGTLAYAAPEQVRGEQPVGTPADIWSVGVVLYELLVGRLPFPGGGPIEGLVEAVRRGVVTMPGRSTAGESIDRDLATVVLKATDQEPGRRYESAAALRSDLERWLEGLPVEARRATAWEALLRAARRHRLVAAGITASVATLAIFAVVVTVLYLKADEAQRRFRKLFEAATESTARASEVHRQAERSLAELSALYVEESRQRRAAVSERTRFAQRLGDANRLRARELAGSGRVDEAREIAWREALTPPADAVGDTAVGISPRHREALLLLREFYADAATRADRPVDELIADDLDRWTQRLTATSPDPLDASALRHLLSKRREHPGPKSQGGAQE